MLRKKRLSGVFRTLTSQRKADLERQNVRVGGFGGGFLAIMARPRAGDWLEDEIADLKKAGVTTLVSLLEPPEVHELGLLGEHDLCRQAGIALINFPIADRGVPESSYKTHKLTGNLLSKIEAGEGVSIHCRAGIGRSGLIAAAVLLHAGSDVPDAFEQVSLARRVEVPDTEEQKDWLIEFSQTHGFQTVGTEPGYSP